MGGESSALEDMDVRSAFWNGKRVLVTGHTGFKGSWLTVWLRELGAHVAGYSLDPPTQPSIYSLAHISDLVESARCADIRDLAQLVQFVSDSRPEIVFHLAAQPLVRLSYAHPVETYTVNVMGTVHLLEAVKKCESCRSVVIVTSDKCYENGEWVWGYRESDPVGGHDPYSSSKACAELVVAAYRRSFFQGTKVGLASARAGNVIGGGDFSPDRLIPDIVSAILKDTPLKVRNPDAIRPWQHVLEPLAGYFLLAERLFKDPSRYSQSWNFGPSHEDTRSVRWLVDNMALLWKRNIQWARDTAPSPHEAHFLTLDSTKAQTLLGWKPRWDLQHALAAVVEWYGAYEDHANLRDVMLRQIESFESTFQRGDIESHGTDSDDCHSDASRSRDGASQERAKTAPVSPTGSEGVYARE